MSSFPRAFTSALLAFLLLELLFALLHLGATLSDLNVTPRFLARFLAWGLGYSFSYWLVGRISQEAWQRIIGYLGGLARGLMHQEELFLRPGYLLLAISFLTPLLAYSIVAGNWFPFSANRPEVPGTCSALLACLGIYVSFCKMKVGPHRWLYILPLLLNALLLFPIGLVLTSRLWMAR